MSPTMHQCHSYILLTTNNHVYVESIERVNGNFLINRNRKMSMNFWTNWYIIGKDGILMVSFSKIKGSVIRSTT